MRPPNSKPCSEVGSDRELSLTQIEARAYSGLVSLSFLSIIRPCAITLTAVQSSVCS